MFCIPTGKLYNIAMENWPFEDVFPSENGVVHCYVSFTRGYLVKRRSWKQQNNTQSCWWHVLHQWKDGYPIIGTLFGFFPPNATLPWFRVTNLMFVCGWVFDNSSFNVSTYSYFWGIGKGSGAPGYSQTDSRKVPVSHNIWWRDT